MDIELEVVTKSDGTIEVIDKDGRHLPFTELRDVVTEWRQKGHKTYVRVPESVDLKVISANDDPAV